MAAEAKPAMTSSVKADNEQSAPSHSPATVPLTRREFLNYAWLASLGFVFVVGFGGTAYFFSYPRFQAGEFGGIFPLGKAADRLPKPSDPPVHNHEGRFWLSNVNGAIIALYDVCVHLGCRYAWQPAAGRFECPCHGSKYDKDGTYIEGPARRGLDRMEVRLVADDQIVAATDAQGKPLAIPSDGNLQVEIDTGRIISGTNHG
jgi:cytochrome b6-f complex iron-sulfur subunit